MSSLMELRILVDDNVNPYVIDDPLLELIMNEATRYVTDEAYVTWQSLDATGSYTTIKQMVQYAEYLYNMKILSKTALFYKYVEGVTDESIDKTKVYAQLKDYTDALLKKYKSQYATIDPASLLDNNYTPGNIVNVMEDYLNGAN